MVNPEVWMFISSNILVFLLEGILTVLSYKAHKRLSQRNLWYTTVGFGLITISTIIEAIYAPGIAGGSWIGERQLLILYTIESLLVAGGLGCIAYSLFQY